MLQLDGESIQAHSGMRVDHPVGSLSRGCRRAWPRGSWRSRGDPAGSAGLRERVATLAKLPEPGRHGV